jgi:hypothetical protein
MGDDRKNCLVSLTKLSSLRAHHSSCRETEKADWLCHNLFSLWFQEPLTELKMKTRAAENSPDGNSVLMAADQNAARALIEF